MVYLIDRNKLWNHIKAQINPYGKPFKGSAYEFGVKLMDYLLEMEVVDAKPVVHGEWEFGKNHGEFVEAECAACKGILLVKWYDEIDRYRFCPNCGARMDGE